jgi:CheY-like chemotaxis protein
MNKSVCKVLLVDNSDDDRLLLRHLVKKHARFHIVAELCDGEDAISYLGGQTIFSDREKYPLPDVMLLDLNMPRTTGYGVLEWLQTRAFEQLKVVAISGSFPHDEVARSLDLGAHAYQMKSGLAAGQMALLAKLEALVDGQEHPPVPKGEKWTTTTLRNWVEVAKSLARKGEPFRVRDVEINLHRIICGSIASDHGLQQEMLDETTMRFTPRSRPPN